MAVIKSSDVRPRRGRAASSNPAIGVRYGEPVSEARYGIVDQQGRVRPTGNGGLDKPKPGERGSVIVQKGDIATRVICEQLGVPVPPVRR